MAAPGVIERLNTAMDQTEIHMIRNIEETRKAMDEKIDRIAKRIHHTIVGPKIAADRLIENLSHAQKAMQETPLTTKNGAHPIHQAVADTIERVKAGIALLEQVKQDPWVMFSSALLMGYVLGSLNRVRVNVVPSSHAHPEVKNSYGEQRPASAARCL
jgi:hypothetical protein